MTGHSKNIAVLAHEGPSRDRLVSVLTALDVAPVWVGRPSQNTSDELKFMHISKIIISLHPSDWVEFKSLVEYLSLSSLDVLYDDATSTATLNDNELDRWAKQLAARALGGAQMPNHCLDGSDPEGFLDPCDEFNQSQARDAVHMTTASYSEQPDSSWIVDNDYDSLEIDPDQLNAELDKLNKSLRDSFDSNEILEMGFEQITPFSEEQRNQFSVSLESDETSGFSLKDIELALQDASLGSTEATAAVDQSNLKDFIDSAALATDPLPSQPPSEPFASRDWDLDMICDATSEAGKSSTGAVDFDLSKFSLVDDIPSGADFAARSVPEQIQQPEYHPAEVDVDLIVVISGQGGPGALRSLVQQVPENFRGTMVSAHHYTPSQLLPLKEQLSRVSKVKVDIAEPEEFLKTGRIYLFPQGMALYSTPLGHQCIHGKWSGYIDSMDEAAQFLILSGADTSLSQSLIQVGVLSNCIHLQDPEYCYDATLIQQLINVGMPIMSPDIVSQWFN